MKLRRKFESKALNDLARKWVIGPCAGQCIAANHLADRPVREAGHS